MILDEFTAIGKVNMIAKSISYQAGYNMRVLTIIQNKSQLEDVYGKSGAVTLMSNHALMIMYAPSPVVQSDAKEYSEMLGDTTVKSKSKSHSYSKQSSHSDSISDQKRALMLPQEIKEIGRWREIVSLENCKPIFCDKIKYFEDPDFTDKINWPLDEKRPIPVIDVNKFIAELQKRLRPATAADKPEDVAGFSDIHKLDESELEKSIEKGKNKFFNDDDSLTDEGAKQRAIEMATKLFRDQNGNLVSREVAQHALLSFSSGRMDLDRLKRMTPGLNNSDRDEDGAVDISEISQQPAAAPETGPKTDSRSASAMDEFFGDSDSAAVAGNSQDTEDPDALTSQELEDIVNDKDDSESEEQND